MIHIMSSRHADIQSIGLVPPRSVPPTFHTYILSHLYTSYVILYVETGLAYMYLPSQGVILFPITIVSLVVHRGGYIQDSKISTYHNHFITSKPVQYQHLYLPTLSSEKILSCQRCIYSLQFNLIFRNSNRQSQFFKPRYPQYLSLFQPMSLAYQTIRYRSSNMARNAGLQRGACVLRVI